jgi:CHASE1-domain containing sensor protein
MSDISGRLHELWGDWRISMAAGAGLLLSIAACYFVWHWEDRAAEQEFAAIAESDLLTLQSGLDEYLNKLVALRATFESRPDISRKQFELFTGRLLLQ